MIHPTQSADNSTAMSDRHRANSYDYQPKRVRKGSISGRLRTASDLEELGFIDKAEKGMIKDLIISGDSRLQALLDKYEQGDGAELLTLIRQGYLARKPSIELIEGLDFDFINALRSEDDEDHPLDDHNEPAWQELRALSKDEKDMMAEPNHIQQIHYTATGTKVKKERRASTDDVADMLGANRSRRASLDTLLLHDLIFEEGMGDIPHEIHDDHGGDSSALFNDLFNQFAQDHLLQQQQQAVGQKGDESVDLSAYAQHAATLQLRDKSGKGEGKKEGNSALRPGSIKKDGSPQHTPAHLPSVGGSHGSSNPYPFGMGSSSGLPLHHHLNHQSVSTASTAALLAGTLAKDGSRPPGHIGAYSAEQRRMRIEKFLEKRNRRVWSRKVKYDVRKNFADSRLRIKGRFVKKEDEDIMRELLNM